MGKRGPKGKSAELESAQGFPGRRKSQTTAAIAAVSAPETSVDDIQVEACYSRFVQPPPYLRSKDERACWAEIMSSPNAAAYFKYSDHRLIARYVQLTVSYERQTKVMPKATYKTTGVNGGQVIKRNPAFDQVMALSRELRSIEQLIAGNPSARVSLEKQGLKKPEDPPPTQQHSAPSASQPAGPLGVLKSKTKMN